MENRKPGFYWVKTNAFGEPDKWQPAEWDEEDKMWDLIGSDCPFEEEEMKEIGEALCHQ